MACCWELIRSCGRYSLHVELDTIIQLGIIFNFCKYNLTFILQKHWHFILHSAMMRQDQISFKISITTVSTKVSCTSCFLYAFYRAASVLRTPRSTLRYASARIRVLRAYYAMFVSRYSARQKAYKKQLVQETFVDTLVPMMDDQLRWWISIVQGKYKQFKIHFNKCLISEPTCSKKIYLVVLAQRDI